MIASILALDVVVRGVAAADEHGGGDGGGSAAAERAVVKAAPPVLGCFEGLTPPLTSAEALDLADLAAIAAELSGRPIRRELITDDELRARLRARGLPPLREDIAVGFYRASRDGEFAAVDPTLAQLIGRPPTPVRALLAAR